MFCRERAWSHICAHSRKSCSRRMVYLRGLLREALYTDDVMYNNCCVFLGGTGVLCWHVRRYKTNFVLAGGFNSSAARIPGSFPETTKWDAPILTNNYARELTPCHPEAQISSANRKKTGTNGFPQLDTWYIIQHTATTFRSDTADFSAALSVHPKSA